MSKACDCDCARSQQRRTPLGVKLAVFGALASSAYVFVVRPWLLSWGATPPEMKRTLPGDESLSQPKVLATQAITVHVPAEEVWAWLVQWGYKRGGFYSYDWIDRALGSEGVTSANVILPEFQHLAVGDKVLVAPDNGFTVMAIEPNRYLVLESRYDMASGKALTAQDALPVEYMVCNWTWQLDRLGSCATRLTARMRIDYNGSPKNNVFYKLFIEPGSAIMQRKMLLGIRDRAEGLGTLGMYE